MVTIPYIVEGEILDVVRVDDDKAAKNYPFSRPVTYRCRVQLQNGRQAILPRVVDHSIFGGIDNYLQVRHRCSLEDDDSANVITNMDGLDADSSDLEATVGDRVYIAFINGEFNRPVIIAHAQHPAQTQWMPADDDQEDHQLFWNYEGMLLKIDKKGQFTLVHNGAPTIKYAPPGKLGAVIGAALNLLSGATDSTPNPRNLAVEPNSKYPDCKTLMEFLELGEWRVRDSLGQMIEVNPDLGRIYIANNAVKSTDSVDSDVGLKISTNSTDSEYVLLDREKELVLINARSIVQLYSFDKRKDVTDGDHSHKIGGDETIIIGGDKTDEIDGSVTRTVKTDVSEDISGNVEWSVGGNWSQTVSGGVTLKFSDKLDMSIKSDWVTNCTGNWTLKSNGDIVLSEAGGAGVKASGGKVEVGGASAGIFDSVSKILEQLDKLIDAIMQITVPTSVGPSGPPINAASMTPIKTQLMTVKSALDSVKGSL